MYSEALDLVMDSSAFSFNSRFTEQFLSPDDIKLWNKNSSEKKYAKGEKVFEERTFPKGIFILKKGRVKLYQSSSTGSEQIIAIHGAEEIFGYRPLLCGDRYPVTAKTLEPSIILFIPRKNFLQVLERSTALSNMLLRYLSQEFSVWVNTISIFGRTTVKERLLLNILLLAEKYREKSKWPIKITLSKTDIASLIGTSKETLARMLKLLKEEKVLVSHGSSIEISSQDQLKRIERQVSIFV